MNSNDSSYLKLWGVEGIGLTFLSTERKELSTGNFVSGGNIRQKKGKSTYSGDEKLRLFVASRSAAKGDSLNRI